MSNLKRKSATGAELLERVTDSDAETEIYWDAYSSFNMFIIIIARSVLPDV